MATKSIKPVSINEAVLNDLARYDNFVQFTPIIIKKLVEHLVQLTTIVLLLLSSVALSLPTSLSLSSLSHPLPHTHTYMYISLPLNNSRFLLNIPREDQDDPMKLCTHIELAYWFYLDLVRPEDSTLPGCSMKEFMAASILKLDSTCYSRERPNLSA